MNELVQSINQIGIAIDHSEGMVLGAYLEYALKADELNESSDVFVQEGLIDKGMDKLAAAGVSYRSFSRLTRLFLAIATAGVGTATLALLSKCGKIGDAIISIGDNASVAGGGALIGSIVGGIICSKYRKKVVTKELMEKINSCILVLVEKDPDDNGDKQYRVDEEMNKLRARVSSMTDDLLFIINNNTVDSSLINDYRKYFQACRRFGRYTNNEHLLNIYRDSESDKLKLTGKKKAKAANARQFPDFVKATYDFLETISGEFDKKPTPGEETGEAANTSNDDKKNDD